VFSEDGLSDRSHNLSTRWIQAFKGGESTQKPRKTGITIHSPDPKTDRKAETRAGVMRKLGKNVLRDLTSKKKERADCLADFWQEKK